MPRVRVDDIRMYYERRGRGFPLVMINGANENLDCWDPRLTKALSAKFGLVLFDNRGAGRTDASDREYSMRLLADDTAHLMSVLSIPKAHVLGISMGGMIAQELAINYPERVSKLVLCSTYSKWVMHPEVSRIVSAMDRGCSRKELLKMYLAIPFIKTYPLDLVREDPSIVHTWTAGFVKNHMDHVRLYRQKFSDHMVSDAGAGQQWTAIRKFNSKDRLQRIKAPTLVLQGKRDFVVPPENGTTLAGGIPAARLIIFGRSAHYLAEEMGRVTEAILEFLA